MHVARVAFEPDAGDADLPTAKITRKRKRTITIVKYDEHALGWLHTEINV